MLKAREMLDERAADVLSQITFLHAVPGLMRQIAAFGSSQKSGSYGNIRAAMVGGDAVSPELLKQMRMIMPAAQIFVGYGPTEATIMCAAIEITDAYDVEHQLVGHPMGNTELRLYDSQQELVPLGVVGEIYIGGRNVSRGYLNADELTREKFVEIEGKRFYRSGDLGRRLSDGSIAFAGRGDGQVKIRGHRIELGEVQAALEDHPSVHGAAVIAKADARGEMRLIGYLVAEEAMSLDPLELRRYVAERLPEYMVPAVLMELERLPLTALGKVDRKALPEAEQLTGERPYEAPRSAVEEILADIWAEVLELKQVSVSDSFFELGGHSLLATQLMSRVRDAFNIELALRAVFEKPTIAGMAEAIEAILIAEIDEEDG
jgi:acyl-CoA synthetase (AMP-forming)/AMP-acid ligase II/acyl carrier protein